VFGFGLSTLRYALLSSEVLSGWQEIKHVVLAAAMTHRSAALFTAIVPWSSAVWIFDDDGGPSRIYDHNNMACRYSKEIDDV